MFLQIKSFKGASNCQFELFCIPWFRYVLVHVTRVDGVYERLNVGVAGEQNLYGIRRDRQRLLQELHSGHPRHALVCDDQRHAMLLQQRECLGAALRLECVVFFVQNASKQPEIRYFVVNEQYLVPSHLPLRRQSGSCATARSILACSVGFALTGILTRNVVPLPCSVSNQI